MIQEREQDHKISALRQEQQKSRAVGAGAQDHTALLMRVVLIGASTIALFYSLGDQLLKTWDESIYAEVAKEMVTRGSWWTLTWNFQPWVDKPPLFMWLTAIMYRCFGVSEITSRLIGVLCGVATIWLTFEIGRRLMDDWGGLAAAFILLTNGCFIYGSRFEAINVPLAFCVTLAAYGYLRVLEGQPHWWYAVGAATGAAIMLKSVAGLAVPLSVGLALLLDRRFRAELRTQEVWNSAFLACAVALPWHVSMVIGHGRVFLTAYLANLSARVHGLDPIPLHKPAYFYLWTYLFAFGPVALVAIIGVLLHLKGQRKSSIVVSIVLVVTICFSLIGTKLMAYALPAFPFISMLAAMTIRRMHIKNAIVCAIIILPLYWSLWFPLKEFQLNYGSFDYGESITSRDEPLMRLLVKARPGAQDLSPTPLIICMDGFRFEKQQAVFYGDRPVVEAFLVFPMNDKESSLDQVVSSRPMPIIIRNDMYPDLEHSAKYNFRVIAQSSPLILGEISRL